MNACSTMMACRGADTRPVRVGCEHMQECMACGICVRDDMVDHHFFGFAAGCTGRDAMMANVAKEPLCSDSAASSPT